MRVLGWVLTCIGVFLLVLASIILLPATHSFKSLLAGGESSAVVFEVRSHIIKLIVHIFNEGVKSPVVVHGGSFYIYPPPLKPPNPPSITACSGIPIFCFKYHLNGNSYDLDWTGFPDLQQLTANTAWGITVMDSNNKQTDQGSNGIVVCPNMPVMVGGSYQCDMQSQSLSNKGSVYIALINPSQSEFVQMGNTVYFHDQTPDCENATPAGSPPQGTCDAIDNLYLSLAIGDKPGKQYPCSPIWICEVGFGVKHSGQ